MSLTSLFITIGQLIDTGPLPKVPADHNRLLLIYNSVIAIFAAATLLVLVIAGLRYVSSVGDPNTMAKTKNTIIYSAIGLLVCLSAFAIVNFALSNV